MKTAKSWTFLSNHGHVMVQLNQNPDLKVKELAEKVGITERSAQSILADLEEAGYISVTRSGRRNNYAVNKNLKFRHPSESNKSIGLLLKIFN
jgi:DNA-binding MarR family transcriptional regulator